MRALIHGDGGTSSAVQMILREETRKIREEAVKLDRDLSGFEIQLQNWICVADSLDDATRLAFESPKSRTNSSNPEHFVKSNLIGTEQSIAKKIEEYSLSSARTLLNFVLLTSATMLKVCSQ